MAADKHDPETTTTSDRQAAATASPAAGAKSFWKVPSPYGYPAAIDSMGSISAPLLAGTSVALAAVLLADPTSYYWLNVTLALLVASTFAFISTIQCTFRARQFVVAPDELLAWWPDPDDDRLVMLQTEQATHRRNFTTWARRSRRAYNGGILLFALGITGLLAPEHVAHQTAGRLAAPVIAAVCFVGEALWIAATAITDGKK